MPFAATQMQLEIIIPNKVKKRNTNVISYMCNLKYDTNEYIYEIETNSQT